MDDNAVSLYENEEFQTAAHHALRPGGLELTGKAVDAARFVRGSRILDIGSGCGTTVAYLRQVRGLQAAGIDVSVAMAAKARGRGGMVEVIVGDACRLPCADSSVDGVLCECVLNLLEEKPLALAEARRVLNPGGRLIISDLYLRERRGGFTGLPLATCINGITGRETVVREVAAAGFRLIDWQDETPVYKGFVAGLIMKYGSMSAFWESVAGSREGACAIQESLSGVRIGYYLSVWEKVRPEGSGDIPRRRPGEQDLSAETEEEGPRSRGGSARRGGA